MTRDDLVVSWQDLRRECDPAGFTFRTTEELTAAVEVIGQQRAVNAIEFGLSIRNHGYNIFVSGVPGTGKNSIVRSLVKNISRDRPVPDDWCFLNNFNEQDHPRAVKLPPGMARRFQREMDRFIEFMLAEVPKAFESKEYEEQKSSIAGSLERSREALFNETNQRALEHGFQLSITRTGIIKMPLHKGRPLQTEEMESLSPEQRREMDEREKRVDSEIRDFLLKVRQLEKEAHEKVHDLNRRVAHFAMGHQLEDLKDRYGADTRVAEYLSEVEEDILSNLKEFTGQAPELPFPVEGMDKGSFLDRYKVNVIVDNGETRGAPVVEETNPVYNNLVGRIERKARFGALFTNFNMIKAGSVLQANGGYLLVNALDVLRSPFSWDALKRIIRKNEVKIEDVGELYGVAMSGIKPEPIPVSLKIIMLGSSWLYYLLTHYDEEFRDMFKVRSDFDTQMSDTDAERSRYAAFIAGLVRNEGLLPFSREAVAEIIDHAVRLTEKKGKLSLRFSDVTDLVRESSYWASRDGKPDVAAAHVDRALEERIYRVNLLEERIHELIADGTLLVDTAGSVVGQVNGLSVYDLGDFAFGKPSRITCRVYLGRSGVIAIDREAKLSGKIYNKGVLILSGYLGGKYAQDRQLSLSASLAFEQSYGEVEGDSASAAELIALLSAVAGVPVRQDIAITGSINQRGDVQPIGGVNEKIEGFFAVCKTRGFTGSQGVVIPRSNVKNLMLKKEVVAAVKEGRFHIYAVSSVDDAGEILTGLAAGERGPDGLYPEGTFNGAVDRQLKEMARKLRADDRSETREKEKKEENNNEEEKAKKETP